MVRNLLEEPQIAGDSASHNNATIQPSRSLNLLEDQFATENASDRKLPHINDVSLATNPTQREHQRQTINKKSWDYIMRTGVAGGLAGCAAKTVVGPLDRVKILYQTSNPQFAKYTGSWFGVFTALGDINRSEGIKGLFRGHSATLLRIFPYAGIKFLAYEQIRNVVIPDRTKETPGRRFISGSAAGICSVFFTYPLEVIRVRLAFETKKSSRSSLRRICGQIYHEQPPDATKLAHTNGNSHHPGVGPATATEAIARIAPRTGLVNFYRGFAPTLLGMVPYAGMSFLTHDMIGDFMRAPALAPYTVMRGSHDSNITTETGKTQTKRAQLCAWAELTAGALAGLVSQTASYPLEVIRRRMQVGGAVGDGHRMSIAETARRIFLEKGSKGFFVGLSIGYVKTIPMVAVSFYVYERGKWLFGI